MLFELMVHTKIIHPLLFTCQIAEIKQTKEQPAPQAGSPNPQVYICNIKSYTCQVVNKLFMPDTSQSPIKSSF